MVQTRSYQRKETKQEASDIPLDLISDILLGFSVKTLSQFKCVCKIWRNLIEDPIFMNRHYKYSEKHKKTFFAVSFEVFVPGFSTKFYSIGNGGIAKSLYPKPFDYPYPKFLNMVSCNGLICSFDVSHNIKVCNPATEETILLPNPGLGRTNYYYETIMLGIGFDSTSEKYKVVCWDLRLASHLRVFTIGTLPQSWRSIECPNPCKGSEDSVYAMLDYGFPVYLNGASHWYDMKKIISFNFSEEIFNIITVPEDHQVKMLRKIFEVNGCICVVGELKIKESEGMVLKIWVLVDFEKQKWVVKQVILPSFETKCSVVLVRDGEIFMQTKSLEASELYLCFYNEEGRVTNWLKVASDLYGMLQSYRESFVSLPRC